ncbi:MAG TPA: DNA polymerase III subunit beta [Negativicutes bacterium]|nr:DNA polymerase III subunit beta [Negativicutes bacterium]
MKIEILKENLKSSVGVVERIVGRNVSLPALNNVFMETEDSFLVLVSTDLETAIKRWVLAKVVKPGKVLVPAKFLSSFVASLPNEKIVLEANGQNLHIECKKVKTHIQGSNPEEFPIIPQFNDAEYLEMDAGKLCEGLSQIIDIPTASTSRPEISGIYFSFFKNNVKIAATDSFRLAEKNISLEKPVIKDYSFILPQRPAREILNALDGKEGALKIYFLNSQVLFELGMKGVGHPEVQITSRLIDGEYPNYQDIIPTKFKTHATLKRDELLNQVKTASLFSGKVNEVKIMVNPEKKEVGIFAKSPEIGEHQSAVDAVIEGDAMEVSFNYKYLVDGLLNIKSSEIVFDISKEEGPCILRPVGDASYIYVVMPIKAM